MPVHILYKVSVSVSVSDSTGLGLGRLGLGLGKVGLGLGWTGLGLGLGLGLEGLDYITVHTTVISCHKQKGRAFHIDTVLRELV